MICAGPRADRERRMIERRIKAATFPATKSLDSFDFKAIPALNKVLVMELARAEFIERWQNIIALGPILQSGVSFPRRLTEGAERNAAAKDAEPKSYSYSAVWGVS